MTKTVIFLLKIVVALVLIVIIFLTTELSEIRNAFFSARFSQLALGIALMPLNIFVQQAKWRYLVKLVKPNVTYTETFGSLLAGLSFGIITPGRIGEYSRSLFIKNETPMRFVGLTIIDKFYNLGFIIALGLPALVTLPMIMDHLNDYFFYSLLGLCAITNLGLLYLALDPRPVRSLIYALQMTFPRQGKIAQLLGGLDRFGAPQARKMLLLTLFYYSIFQIQYFIIISSFADIDLFSSMRASATVLFTKTMLPVSIGDLGLDQIASMKFFGSFGVSQAEALNASLLLFTVNVLIPALAGIPFISRLQFDKLKRQVKP